ncbi:MAG: GNAT family N-acetyltransferase [Tissierellia bacterium]|nr:GNAT family N-acetyltransferase [Tissierellia bacterium]
MITLYIDNYAIAPMEREHIDSMMNWGKHDDPMMLCYNFPYRQKEELDAWFKMKTGPWNNRYFSIIREDQTLGYLGLKKIDFRYRVCELGLVINPDFMGYGIGSKVLHLFLRHYFFDLNMSKIKLTVAVANERAQALYKNEGFRQLKKRWVSFEPDVEESLLVDRPHLRKWFGKWQEECYDMILLRSHFVELIRARGES